MKKIGTLQDSFADHSVATESLVWSLALFAELNFSSFCKCIRL